MSQEKVEKYKAEKLNRKQLLKKKARQKILANTIVVVVMLAFVGMIGYGIYNKTVGGSGTNAKTVNLEAMDEYLNGLDGDIAMATYEEESTATPAAVSSQAAE